jgi:vitamin B12 transporter
MAITAPAFAADDELVVTATRLSTRLDKAPDVEVVTGEQIALRQATFAFDVLASVPGVQISRTGDFGGVTSLRIRGASSDKTLVLVDGAEVNDPTAPAGGFDFASLDLANVERIEVLEGPQGSLWGSDAIGGVVSITTREPDGLQAAGEGGAHGSWRASGSAGLADSRKALGADVAWFSTGGISKADARDGNTERDPFHSLTAQVNGRIALSNAVSLDGKLRYNTAHAAFDSFGGPTGVIDGPDFQDGWMLSGFARATIKGPLGFDQELRADGMKMDRTSESAFGGTLFPFEAKGRRLDLRWTAQRSDLGPNAILVGVERQSAREDTGDGPQSSRNWAGFAIWRFTPVRALTTTVSVRRDEPRDYKGVTTVRASGLLALGAGFSLGGAWGQGFKAPSIFQTTYPCFECTVPGPNLHLKPERAEGWDASLSWRSAGGRLNAKLTGYRLTVRDQIDYQFPQGYLNIDRTRTDGIEAEASAELGRGFALNANYAWADARDLSSGAPLLRIPKHSASAELSWKSGRAEADLTVRGQSKAADVFGEIRPFAVADLAGSYALGKHVRLTGRIENITDKHYQEAFGYGEPGFGVFFGVRLTN